jgi:6,7-dimethyl-8-ribityllumazine synthase
MRIALVVSGYHAFVTDRLEAGARARLREAGLAESDVVTFAVPGAFELPQAARRLAETGDWDATVCLGCLIRGETPHFEYIAQAVAHGLTRAAADTGVPIAFGVLTTNTAEEALARAGDGPANKGREAAGSALAMAALYATIPAARRGSPVKASE